jgi:hypothetical protein
MPMPLLSRLARETPLRWYLPNKVTRQDLIQRSIDALGARTYLEIGVDEGQSFCAVNVPSKVGVDPVAPMPAVVRELDKPNVSYEAMTSDAFFESTARQRLTSGVDVAFVDGLHTYGQTYRDICNCLNYLNPGGVILVHDCLPASAQEARVAATYEEAARLNGPDWNGLWTGDGWKAITAVRAGHQDVEAAVLNCDHGVGIIHRGANRAGVRLSPAEIDALEYRDLAADPARLIGLRRPRYLLDALRRLRAARTRTAAAH